MKHLYIIGGCNGAGKTTAAFTMLPQFLGCKEFVNADEIARGLSPFNRDEVAFLAGRIMLERIDHLIEKGVDLAFESTLATKSFVKTIENAREKGYAIVLVFYYLNSPILAEHRVARRVQEGGHDIPKPIIHRRYHAGLRNFFNLYLPEADFCMAFDNSVGIWRLLYEGSEGYELVHNEEVWQKLKEEYHDR